MFTIDQLSLQLPLYASWWKREWATCLDDVSLAFATGEVHALVGASGAGKSLLAYAMMGLLPAHARLTGQLYYQGALLDLSLIHI